MSQSGLWSLLFLILSILISPVSSPPMLGLVGQVIAAFMSHVGEIVIIA